MKRNMCLLIVIVLSGLNISIVKDTAYAQTWTQPSGTLTGTPNWGYGLAPLYDGDVNTATELNEAQTYAFPYSYFGVRFDASYSVSGLRFYSYPQGWYQNHITTFKVWVLPPQGIEDNPQSWQEVVSEQGGVNTAGWTEVVFPNGAIAAQQVRVIYTSVSYGAAPKVGELEFLNPIPIQEESFYLLWTR